jgi:hypothetical protein
MCSIQNVYLDNDMDKLLELVERRHARTQLFTLRRRDDFVLAASNYRFLRHCLDSVLIWL